MNNIRKSDIITAQIHKDSRGSLKFFNSFKFPHVVRFYEVKNSIKEPIRAFHGHMLEEKFVYVITGKILLIIVKLSNPNHPSKKTKVEKFILSESPSQILHIPAGYANGFKSLTKNARVIFYSTLPLEKSIKDDYRFSYDYWGKDIWNT